MEDSGPLSHRETLARTLCVATWCRLTAPACAEANMYLVLSSAVWIHVTDVIGPVESCKDRFVDQWRDHVEGALQS